MRFIRQEHIITTIFNKDLKDDEDINNVFNNLYKYAVDFSIVIKKEDSFLNICFEKVRVLKINDDSTFDMLVTKDAAKIIMRNVRFLDIVEILAETKKHNILDTDDALTRWEILDLHK